MTEPERDWAEAAREWLSRRERSGFPTGQWPEEQLATLLRATWDDAKRESEERVAEERTMQVKIKAGLLDSVSEWKGVAAGFKAERDAALARVAELKAEIAEAEQLAERTEFEFQGIRSKLAQERAERDAARAEVEKFRYASDKQAVAWKERAEKAEAALRYTREHAAAGLIWKEGCDAYPNSPEPAYSFCRCPKLPVLEQAEARLAETEKERDAFCRLAAGAGERLKEAVGLLERLARSPHDFMLIPDARTFLAHAVPEKAKDYSWFKGGVDKELLKEYVKGEPEKAKVLIESHGFLLGYGEVCARCGQPASAHVQLLPLGHAFYNWLGGPLCVHEGADRSYCYQTRAAHEETER
jgi:hypothetical protein